MNLLRRFFKNIFIFSLIGLFFSCDEEPQPSSSLRQGALSFSFDPGKSSGAFRTMEDSLVVNQMLVTIEDTSGKKVLERKKVEVYELNGSYLSKKIALKEGQYDLTEFLVMKDNKVIYAAPKSGSEYADYVNNSLPIQFEIMPDSTSQINPEVLEVSKDTIGSKIGYATFGFNIVNDTIINYNDIVNLDSGLIAYYPFNGNTKDSMGNHDANLFGGGKFVTDRFGRSKSALEFDGQDDYISIPYDFDIPEKSLSIWFQPYRKPDSVSLFDANGIFNTDHENLEYGVLAMAMNRSTDPPQLHLRGGGSGSDHYYSPIYMDSLYHVVITMGTDSIKYYLNGDKLGQYAPYYGGSAANTTDTNIGSSYDISRFFYGVIDDVRIYNRVIDKNAVKALNNK